MSNHVRFSIYFHECDFYHIFHSYTKPNLTEQMSSDAPHLIGLLLEYGVIGT